MDETQSQPTSEATTETVSQVTSESKPADSAVTNKESSDLQDAQRFAAIARAQRAARAEQAKVSAEREKLEATKKELEQIQSFKTKIDGLKGKPADAYRFLTEDLGVNLDESFVEAVVGSQKSPEIRAIEEKLASFEARAKAEEEARAKAEAARKEASEKASESHAREAVSSKIREFGDRYEMISAQGKEGLVYDTIAEYYGIHGVVPRIEDIADMVESHLESEARSLLKISKVSKLMQAAPAKAASNEAHQTKAQLTNSITNGSAPIPSRSRVMDESELVERAAAKLRFS